MEYRRRTSVTEGPFLLRSLLRKAVSGHFGFGFVCRLPIEIILPSTDPVHMQHINGGAGVVRLAKQVLGLRGLRPFWDNMNCSMYERVQRMLALLARHNPT